MTKEGFLKQVPLVKMSKDIEFSINFHKDVIFHMRCHLSYEVSTIGVILKSTLIKSPSVLNNISFHLAVWIVRFLLEEKIPKIHTQGHK